MKNKIKSIKKIILFCALIICWSMSIGYASKIEPSSKNVNFYLLNDSTPISKIDEIRDMNEEISIVGWREDSNQEVINTELNKKIDDVNVLTVKGDLSLLIKSNVLLEDDIEGCTLDEETSYKLFGDTNVVGNKIEYNNRKLIIVGIHNDTDNNLIINASNNEVVDNDEEVTLNGITIDKTNISYSKIKEFKVQNNLEAMDIDNSFYYSIARFVSLLVPLLVLSIILIRILNRIVKSRYKPFKVLLYSILVTSVLIIFVKITNINIRIPVDMLPNKWSDFDFWHSLYKEYVEKYKYVINMKKYGFDIYNINNLFNSIIYSLLSVVLFIVNMRFIRFKNTKELSMYSFMAIIATFIVIVFISNSKYGFDVNIPMVWTIYILYIWGEFCLNKKNINEDEE